MIVEAPVTSYEKKPVKQNKGYLNECLASSMRELTFTKDGRQITKAQAITERVVSIAMYAESNSDALAASRFIFERLGGKAAVMKDEEVKPMPMISFTLNTEGYEKIKAAGLQKVDELVEPEFNSDEYLNKVSEDI